jgi:CRISPR-associated protein Cmr4
MNARLTFVHALSPLHAGTGQGVGVIDLPVAREKATGLPYLPGSTLKGVLRDQYDRDNEGKRKIQESIFGPEKIDNENGYAGAAQFSDQRLLCLPVRSLAGTFAWVTSPFILHRLKRDAKNIQADELPDVEAPAYESKQVACHVTEETVLKLTPENKVILEDLDLTPEQPGNANVWADWIGKRIFPNEATWQNLFAKRFCIVPDDLLTFLVDTALEVTARIKLDDATKTVADGQLWYEEALPAETILSGLAIATPIKKTKELGYNEARIFQELSEITVKPLQLGGKATVGRGLCSVRIAAAEA